MNQIRWLGYEFHVYGLESVSWNDVPGIYIFSALRGSMWHAIYVGQAGSFKSRLPSHERLPDVLRHGVGHVHAMVVQQSGERDRIERDLIQRLQPPLNTQLKELSLEAAAFLRTGLFSLSGTSGGLQPSPPRGLLGIASVPKPVGGLDLSNIGLLGLPTKK